MDNLPAKTSAFERLKLLPEVFTLNTLAAFTGGDAGKAAVYAHRWKHAGLIAPLGPRVGVFFNLLKNPRAPSERLLDAVKLVFPEAVLSGVSVIHRAGWTTQIPRIVDINILTRRTVPRVDGVDLHLRPREWYIEFADQILREGFPRLDPEFALADAWKYKVWRPDPDDLDFDEINVGKLVGLFDRLREPYPRYFPQAPENRGLAPQKPRPKSRSMGMG